MSYIPEQVKLCLKDLIERLGRHRIKYVVIGALPVHFYGRPRTSADIDIVPISRISKERLKKILADRYTLYYDRKTVMRFIDSVTRAGVDILLSLSTAGLSQGSLKKLRRVNVDGVRKEGLAHLIKYYREGLKWKVS